MRLHGDRVEVILVRTVVNLPYTTTLQHYNTTTLQHFNTTTKQFYNHKSKKELENKTTCSLIIIIINCLSYKDDLILMTGSSVYMVMYDIMKCI